MEDAELITVARRLARPCTLLKRTGPAESFAAIWGGIPVVSGPSGPYRHWISVDCRFIPKGLARASGVLSIFTNEKDCVSGVVAFDESAQLSPSATSSLFAHPGESLPPPDALPLEVYDQYLPVWQSNCPIYTNEAVAVVGGWHFPWPDGDWEKLREKSLLLWTIDESEPWVEVWKDHEGFRVIQRIT